MVYKLKIYFCSLIYKDEQRDKKDFVADHASFLKVCIILS